MASDFEAAYRAYYKQIRDTAARKYYPDLADDLAQETFIVAFRNWNKIKTPFVLSWLKTILSRVWFRHLGSGKFKKRQADLVSINDIDVASDGPDIIAYMDGVRLIDNVRSLPSGDGRCIELSAMGYETTEIAEVLGVSRERVRQRISRGMKRLDRQWEETYGGKMSGEIDDIVIRKARQLAADSKEYGWAVRNGILGGQWDRGEIVRSFIPEAERLILKSREEANDE